MCHVALESSTQTLVSEFTLEVIDASAHKISPSSDVLATHP